MNDMNFSKKCRWCTREAINSHIMSKLTLRTARNTLSSTEFSQLRNLTQPSKIHQDIAKLPLLCGSCDGSLSRIERIFRNKFYKPLLSNRATSLEYGDWLQKFVVFTAWKILALRLEQLENLDRTIAGEAEKARDLWERFLRGESNDVGHYEHHAFITWFRKDDWFSEAHWKLLWSSFECTLIPAKDGLWVWTTIPGCIFVSLIYSESVTLWSDDTRIKLKGTFKFEQRMPYDAIEGWNKVAISDIQKTVTA